MLLIDGVKYFEWMPTNEDELEQMVKEHAQEIFGENSIYLDMKSKLTSRAGIGSIPDGYVISLDKPSEWHIIEVELSPHQLYEHIVPQVSRFVAGIANVTTRNQMVSALYNEINGSDLWKMKVRQAIGYDEVYKFMSELVAKPPVVTIVIEKKTPELEDALNAINCPEKRVIEFRTFRRANAETVHTHLFEPLKTSVIVMPISETPQVVSREPLLPPKHEGKRISIRDLLGVNILKVNQLIFKDYNDKRYEGRITSDGMIKLGDSGREFSSPSGAASSITPNQVDGWTWWYTTDESGRQVLLDSLRKRYTRI